MPVVFNAENDVADRLKISAPRSVSGIDGPVAISNM